jgi:hypothetical protein
MSSEGAERTSVAELLSRARERLDRLTPEEAWAAATLRRFGLDTTDVIGGVQGWRAAGEPLIAAGAEP